jgi:hypothetical protein
MTKRKTGTAAAQKANAKAAAEQRTDSAKTVGVDVSAADLAKARKDGALRAEGDAAAADYKAATDGNLASPPDETKRTWLGYDEIQQYAPMLNLGVEAFEAAIAADAQPAIPENKVYGLLALERNGQNRTPYVKAVMDRLDLDVSELPGGGPGYTNDVHPISEL